MRKILLAVMVAGLAMPVGAMTQPDDIVGIYIEDGPYPTVTRTAKYFKKWKDLQLSPATIKSLMNRNALIDKEADGEKFRLGFLYMSNDAILRVSFYGDIGTVKISEWPNGETCTLSLTGNGGIAGVTGKPCH